MSGMRHDGNNMGSEGESGAEDEDEETLELKLQAIEARLKLKKLRQSKSSQIPGVKDDVSFNSRTEKQKPEARYGGSQMQIPLSPIKERRSPVKQNHIHRGMDMLASPPRQHSTTPLSSQLLGGYNSRQLPISSAASSISSISRATTLSCNPSLDAPSKSFSERIAGSRQSAMERAEKETKILKARSKGFHSRSRTQEDDKTPSQRSSVVINRSTKVPFIRNTSTTPQLRHKVSSRKSASTDIQPGEDNQIFDERSDVGNSKSPKDSSSLFEPYSGFNLSRRWHDHKELTRLLEDKELFPIPKLFKVVKSPNYEPPDMEKDFVVFGIVAWKSTPYDHKKEQQQEQGDEPENQQSRRKPYSANRQAKSKFMVIKLTDMKWELDMFLFDTGFDQFWKMSLGTVVAILNPGIFPPKNADTGKFSLKLSSSEDTVVEIGSAQDLGFCKSVKKDGRKCCTWIDKRRTEYCDFHVSLQLEKAKAGRMEVNGSSTFAGINSRGGGGRQRHGKSKDDGLLKEGRQHDRQLHETYYLAPSHVGLVKNASALIDADDDDMGINGAERGRSKRELNRKRVLDKARERELARKLGNAGNGIGNQYLRSIDNKNQNLPSGHEPYEKPGITNENNQYDAESLGLVRSSATVTKLSKIGRTNTHAVDEPMGWSSAFKSGAIEKKIESRKVVQMSPTRKKARFALEKGLREPGRDSLNMLQAESDGSNDDELEIV